MKAIFKHIKTFLNLDESDRKKLIKDFLTATQERKKIIMRLRLRKFANIHKNQRCFVIGNGPSLNKIDMTLLKNEITFGANRCYLGFPQWGFHFKYWAIQDELHIKQCYQEYNENLPPEMIKFISLQFSNYFKGSNIYPVNVVYSYKPFPQFSDNINIFYEGWSVVYLLLQLAVVMGCNPIYMIGVDYNFNITEKEKVGDKKWSDTESKSHFISNYMAANKGVVWNTPKFDKTDAAFNYASNLVKEKGIQVLNATPGSKLTFFPMIDYKSIFN